MWQVPDRWVEPSPCFVTLPELVACADVVQANDWRIFVLATAATATATSTAIWLWKAVEDQYLQRNFVRKLQSSRVHLDHNCPGSIQDRFDIYIYCIYICVFTGHFGHIVEPRLPETQPWFPQNAPDAHPAEVHRRIILVDSER